MISKEYNVRNLVYDANFEVKLCKDLYWIPMNYLGIPKRCNEEYLRLKDCNLTYVQDIISCVYDAIQYLNAIGFYSLALHANIYHKKIFSVYIRK